MGGSLSRTLLRGLAGSSAGAVVATPFMLFPSIRVAVVRYERVEPRGKINAALKKAGREKLQSACLPIE